MQASALSARKGAWCPRLQTRAVFTAPAASSCSSSSASTSVFAASSSARNWGAAGFPHRRRAKKATAYTTTIVPNHGARMVALGLGHILAFGLASWRLVGARCPALLSLLPSVPTYLNLRRRSFHVRQASDPHCILPDTLDLPLPPPTMPGPRRQPHRRRGVPQAFPWDLTGHRSNRRASTRRNGPRRSNRPDANLIVASDSPRELPDDAPVADGQFATPVDLVKAVQNAAHIFLAALEDEPKLRDGPGFLPNPKWLGFDRNSWMKTLAYQGALHALMRAVVELVERSEGRDRDSRTALLRSLGRLSVPLETAVHETLSARRPSAPAWLWAGPHPAAVDLLRAALETDPMYNAATQAQTAITERWRIVGGQPQQQQQVPRTGVGANKAGDAALLSLGVRALGTARALGQESVSCPPFSLTLTEETSRLLTLLLSVESMEVVYAQCEKADLRSVFLQQFASRAGFASSTEGTSAERPFWVKLVMQQLTDAIRREGILTGLPEDVQAEDLAVFGFFAYLGRSARLFLAPRGAAHTDDVLASLLRFWEGAFVIYHQEMQALANFQLFVEVISEELEWLPLFEPTAEKVYDDDEGLPDGARAGKKTTSGWDDEVVNMQISENAITTAIQTCRQWLGDFSSSCDYIKDHKTSPAAVFTRDSERWMQDCRSLLVLRVSGLLAGKVAGVGRGFSRMLNAASQGDSDSDSDDGEDTQEAEICSGASSSSPSWDANPAVQQLAQKQQNLQNLEMQLEAFDDELRGVEKVISKLESVLSSSSTTSGNGIAATMERALDDKLSTASSQLQIIRNLVLDVRALEGALRAKAVVAGAAVEQGIRQATEQQRRRRHQRKRKQQNDFVLSWLRPPKRDDDDVGTEAAEAGTSEGGGSRADNSSSSYNKEERGVSESPLPVRTPSSSIMSKQDKPSSPGVRDYFQRSLEQLKEGGQHYWRGTQLLATDVAGAAALLKRGVAGQHLTDREKRKLKRTVGDVANVIPIGVLMLLPVTPAGHALILASIQKYLPWLMPSAFAEERLEMIKRLEQIKAMQPMPNEDQPGPGDSTSTTNGAQQLTPGVSRSVSQGSS